MSHKKLDIYLDVDGTLIDKDDNLRPHVVELITSLHDRGFGIYIWSGGGLHYAADHARRIFKLCDNPDIHINVIEKDLSKVRSKSKYNFVIDDMQDIVDNFRDMFDANGYRVAVYDAALSMNDNYLRYAFSRLLEYIEELDE